MVIDKNFNVIFNSLKEEKTRRIFFLSPNMNTCEHAISKSVELTIVVFSVAARFLSSLLLPVRFLQFLCFGCAGLRQQSELVEGA